MSGNRKLGKPTDQRKAMLRAMVTYLLENGQIKTTLARAKEVAPLTILGSCAWAPARATPPRWPSSSWCDPGYTVRKQRVPSCTRCFFVAPEGKLW